MSQFEEWFQLQSFYLNLRFIHGERLFIFDAQDGYVVQAVQIAWMTWQEQQKQTDELKSKINKQSELLLEAKKSWTYTEREKNLIQSQIDDLEKILKCEPKEEPQACDHTIAEKTQFGDLHRTFECIFCDHKTIEAWVTTHE
ncbi:hypothetical protein ACX1NX_01725 [Acinetobacter sp. ANC 5383]